VHAVLGLVSFLSGDETHPQKHDLSADLERELLGESRRLVEFINDLVLRKLPGSRERASTVGRLVGVDQVWEFGKVLPIIPLDLYAARVPFVSTQEQSPDSQFDGLDTAYVGQRPFALMKRHKV
jgi:hypothetical protein